jgi:2-polyprenyl-3-methyl-5-hydroxy-6-metoxy-1,4-benzoquinol methylase
MDIDKLIIEACTDKDVLEVGGLGDFNRYLNEDMENWRHIKIKKIARKVIGIDIQQEFVDAAKKLGFHYSLGDIENIKTMRKLGQFDIILFLDVIEHLNNVSFALENIKTLLVPGGKVIITTPNAFSFSNLFRIFTARELNEFPDHTCSLFPSHIQELFKRQQLIIEKLQYISFLDKRPEFKMKSRLTNLLAKHFQRLNTHLLIIGGKI